MKSAGIFRATFKFIRNTIFLLLIGQFAYIVVLKYVNPPITITQLASWIEGDGLARDYVSMKNISPNAKLAVMAAEDQLYPDHNGFDVKSIKKALKYNNAQTKRMRGASTISQQVAKNVFLWQGRSWVRKGLEVYFTFMIELVWGKQRILDVYLNVVEMGKGVYGIEAAAQKFFNKPALQLTKREAAMIAVALPNPKKISVKPPSAYVTKRSEWVVAQMDYLARDVDMKALLSESKQLAY